MKKFARKVRKAVKATMPKYYAHLDMEMDKRRQAEKIAALVKNENHDMAKTINQLADEKLAALNKIDELVMNAAEIAKQRDAALEDAKKYQETIIELQKARQDAESQTNTYLQGLVKSREEKRELQDRVDYWKEAYKNVCLELTEAKKPFFKKLFKC